MHIVKDEFVYMFLQAVVRDVQSQITIYWITILSKQ